MIGKTVSHYRVVEKLGEGGMGVVYRAEDARLGRSVALKFLPERLAGDPEAIERFQREARAASALNHPGICTVHDIDESEGRWFIALELLEGQPLDEKIGGRPLALPALLELGIQIADALDAAHAKGVIHRDLKPANIFVTPRQAKLMDFGLAKLKPGREAADAAARPTEATWKLTADGAVMGTMAYMSPEQLRGEPLGARTDLFSLGMVLYEMATGQQPFAGTTTGVVIDGILNREPPPPSAANPALPPELDRIVAKALEKDKEVRYQTARDLLADLRRLRRDTTSGRQAVSASHPDLAAATTAPSTPPAARRLGLVAGAALLVVVALVALATRLASPPPAPRIDGVAQITSDRVAKFRPLTDGTRIYFTRARGLGGETTGIRFDSVLAQVAVTGGEAQTLDVPFHTPSLVDISPDGTDLLVLAQREILGTVSGASPLWIVPVLGGTPRPVGDLRADDAAWSPDGTTIAYTTGADVFLVGPDGSDRRRIWTAPGNAHTPAWTPDGRRLRLTVTDPADGLSGAAVGLDQLVELSSSLWEVGADGEDPHPVLPGFELPACCGRWGPDGASYVFTAGRDRQDIWLLPERRGWLSRGSAVPTRLTQGPLSYASPVWSSDGERIFAEGLRVSGELVRCALGSGECAPYLGGIDAEGASFSLDGQWVSWAAPDTSLWRSRIDGSERLRLTFPPLLAVLPQWSPDGSRIAFAGSSEGSAIRIWLVPAAGGPSREAVPQDDGSQIDATWSPDGDRIAFGRVLTFGPEDPDMAIRIASLDAGPVTVVPGSQGLFSPRWSRDGRHLAALSHDSLRLLLYEFSSQRWRPLLDAGTVLAYPAWSRDGEHLFVTEDNARVRVRIADGRKDVVHTFEGLQPLARQLGIWVGHAPDDSILTLRDTSLDEIFALELERP